MIFDDFSDFLTREFLKFSKIFQNIFNFFGDFRKIDLPRKIFFVVEHFRFFLKIFFEKSENHTVHLDIAPIRLTLSLQPYRELVRLSSGKRDPHPVTDCRVACSHQQHTSLAVDLHAISEKNRNLGKSEPKASFARVSTG